MHSETMRDPGLARAQEQLRSRGGQRAFGGEWGYSEPYISTVLHGKAPATLRFRKAVAAFVGVPETELFA